MVTDTDTLTAALRKLVVSQFRRPDYVRWVRRKSEWIFSVDSDELLGRLAVFWDSKDVQGGGVLVMVIYKGETTKKLVPWADPECDTIIAKTIRDWFEQIKLR